LIRKHELSFDKVVVGGTLSALKFAKENHLPIIIYKPTPPHRFSEEHSDGEFGRLAFLLSLVGQIPFDEKVDSIRYEKNNSLRISTRNAFLFVVQFNKLIIFSDDGVVGLPAPISKTSEMFEVIDWINVRSGMSHDHEKIEDTSDFVKCIHFYPTDRLDGYHPNKKDAAAISYMTIEQLEDLDWSDTYVRFKVLDMMKEVGIRGQSCGKSRYALKIETALREVFPLGKNVYPEINDVEFK
jgi:hypothetical protein